MSETRQTAGVMNGDTVFPLLGLVPPVLRARDFRLYTEGGKRLLDLWQNGGAAVLGHTPPAMLRELKNSASRGLFSPLPHPLERRFVRALSRLFSGRVFRVYADETSFRTALGLCGGAFDGKPGDPAFGAGSRAEAGAASSPPRACLWRPFLDPRAPLAVPADAPLLIPVLPGIQGWSAAGALPRGLCVLALDPALASAGAFPPQDTFSPVFLAAAARGIYDLAAAAPLRGNPRFPKIDRALAQKGCPWRRRGIYLSHDRGAGGKTAGAESGGVPPGAWEALFRAFLEEGFLLPPVSEQPLILPGVLSAGEEAKLARLLG
ncbi:MAG: hypothetical protein LBP27_06210 [Treponema sp.]|jgi:hypothetical protein|nr:hypothetical protein [Treponema sp.]